MDILDTILGTSTSSDLTRELANTETREEASLSQQHAANGALRVKMEDNASDDGSSKCAVCLGSITSSTGLDGCQHVFCYTCISEWLKHNEAGLCPLCKSKVTELTRHTERRRPTRLPLATLREKWQEEMRLERGNAVPLTDEKGIITEGLHLQRTLINGMEREMNAKNQSGDSYKATSLKNRYRDHVSELTALRLLCDQIDDGSINRRDLIGNPRFRELIYSVDAEWYQVDPNANPRRAAFTKDVAQRDRGAHKERIIPWLRNELNIVLIKPIQLETDGRGGYSSSRHSRSSSGAANRAHNNLIRKTADELFDVCKNHQIHSPNFRRIAVSLGVLPKYAERFQHELYEFACSHISMRDHFSISGYRKPMSRRPIANSNFAVGGLHGVSTNYTPQVVDLADDVDDVIVLDGDSSNERGESNYVRDDPQSSGSDVDADTLYVRRACLLRDGPPSRRVVNTRAGMRLTTSNAANDSVTAAAAPGHRSRWLNVQDAYGHTFQVNSDGTPVVSIRPLQASLPQPLSFPSWMNAASMVFRPQMNVRPLVVNHNSPSTSNLNGRSEENETVLLSSDDEEDDMELARVISASRREHDDQEVEAVSNGLVARRPITSCPPDSSVRSEIDYGDPGRPNSSNYDAAAAASTSDDLMIVSSASRSHALDQQDSNNVQSNGSSGAAPVLTPPHQTAPALRVPLPITNPLSSRTRSLLDVLAPLAEEDAGQSAPQESEADSQRSTRSHSRSSGASMPSSASFDDALLSQSTGMNSNVLDTSFSSASTGGPWEHTPVLRESGNILPTDQVADDNVRGGTLSQEQQAEEAAESTEEPHQDVAETLQKEDPVTSQEPPSGEGGQVSSVAEKPKRKLEEKDVDSSKSCIKRYLKKAYEENDVQTLKKMSSWLSKMSDKWNEKCSEVKKLEKKKRRSEGDRSSSRVADDATSAKSVPERSSSSRPAQKTLPHKKRRRSSKSCQRSDADDDEQRVDSATSSTKRARSGTSH